MAPLLTKKFLTVAKQMIGIYKLWFGWSAMVESPNPAG